MDSQNLECSLPLSSVNLLIPERGVMTHFLCSSPGDLPLTTFDHLAVVDYSLQLLLIYRSTVHPFCSSEAYMTNHTSHFKQLELSLAINHLDSCYRARYRAASRREEGKGELWELFSTFGQRAIVKQTQGLGHIVVRCIVCFYDLNKNQSENNKGLYFLCTAAQGI